MTQTKFGAACSSEINTFYRVHLSQPLPEILIFLGIVYISDLTVSTFPLESKPHEGLAARRSFCYNL
jgi:hypothetical protein